jgi:hypothetical protein
MAVHVPRHPPPVLPLERPGTHCIGGWIAPRAVLDGCGKSRPQPRLDPRTVRPVASHCTYCVIPAFLYILYSGECSLAFVETLAAL